MASSPSSSSSASDNEFPESDHEFPPSPEGSLSSVGTGSSDDSSCSSNSSAEDQPRPVPPSSSSSSSATSLHHSSSVEPSSSPPSTSFPQPSSHSADPQPTSSSVSRSRSAGGPGGPGGGRLLAFLGRKHGDEGVAALDGLRPGGERQLLIFCNSRSGGQQGAALLGKLRRLFPGEQVRDLVQERGPESGFARFLPRPEEYVVLVCGGDGSVSWVLSYLDALDPRPEYPPFAVLPLGTGNDLARVLGWGGGYTGKDLTRLLGLYLGAVPVPVDRWEVRTELEGGQAQEEAPRVMNNYYSVGFDAKIALDFHTAREANPDKFKSRAGNKMYYGVLGAKSMGSAPPLSRIVSASILSPGSSDWQPLELGPGIRGLIVQNIPSYAGGTDLWTSKRSRRFQSQSMSDGLLEVIGVSGSFHMGRIATGMGSGIRLAQVVGIRIRHQEPMAAQVDGEAWPLAPGETTITHFNRVNFLKRVHTSRRERRQHRHTVADPPSDLTSSTSSPAIQQPTTSSTPTPNSTPSTSSTPTPNSTPSTSSLGSEDAPV